MPETTKRRFADLEAFQDETAFPLEAVSAVWDVAQLEARAEMDQLIDRGLVEALPTGRYQTHSLVLALAKSLKEESHRHV